MQKPYLPPQVDPQLMPPDPLNATILELSGWYLEVRCSCEAMTQYPLLPLCARLHPRVPTIAEAASRFVCERCGGRPAAVWLLERAGGNPHVEPQPRRLPIPLRSS